MGDSIRSYIVLAARGEEGETRRVRLLLAREAKRYSESVGCRVGMSFVASTGKPVGHGAVDRAERFLAKADVVLAEISVYDLAVWDCIGAAARAGKPVLCLASTGAGNGDRDLAVRMLKAAYPRIRFVDYATDAEIREIFRRYFMRELPKLVAA